MEKINPELKKQIETLPNNRETILGTCALLAQQARQHGITNADWRETFDEPEKFLAGEGGANR